MMNRLLREPLLHFLIAGGLLFILYGYVGDTGREDSSRITVGLGQIERLKQAWKKQWGRAPTERELRNLIEKHIEEEVLNREAVAMGLEKDDIIIRRRLAQKMRFLIQDIADQAQPTHDDLKAYYDSNRNQYRIPARISFTHVYLSADRRGGATIEDARTERDRLNAQHVERAPERGDPFMLHYDYTKISEAELAKLFGRGFARELFKLEPGPWHGPIRSGYGVHIVRVLESVPSRLPDFEEVADRVRRDLLDFQRRTMNEAAIRELRSRYTVIIEKQAKQAPERQASQRTGAESPR